MVPYTDLHRVPDSESTSALVSHIWPSSAHTRCCSCCCRSHKPSRMTGAGQWLQRAHFSTTSTRLVQSVLMGKNGNFSSHQGFIFWKHISEVLKITQSFQRYVVSFRRQDFNYNLRKTMKRSNFDVINGAPHDVLLSTERSSENTSPFLKRLLCFFVFFNKLLLGNYLWWRNYGI